MILNEEEKDELAGVISNHTKSFAELNTAEGKINGTVRKTGPEQIITGRQEFVKGDLN